MRCGLTLPGLPTRRARRVTLDSGIRVLDCPIYPASVEESPAHRRYYARTSLNACIARVHDAMVPSVLTVAKWNALAPRLCVCIVAHPFEWQDRASADVPICVDGIANPIIRKVATVDRTGEPIPIWQGFTRLLVRGVFQAASVDPTAEQIEAVRDAILPGLRADVAAALEAIDQHDAMIAWCHANCTVTAVIDWITHNPPPPGWTGYMIDIAAPGQPPQIIAIQWGYENRDTIFPPTP